MGDNNSPERSLGAAEAKTFTVGVREVHVRFYSVQAENEEQAIDLVHQRGEGIEDIGYEEFSHELDRSTWSAEGKQP